MRRTTILILAISIFVPLTLAGPAQSPASNGKIIVDGSNDFIPVNIMDIDGYDCEHRPIDFDTVYVTNDANKLYIGFYYDKEFWTTNQLGIMLSVSNTSGGTTDAWGHAIAWNTASHKPDYQAWCNMDDSHQELRMWVSATSSWDSILYAGTNALGWVNYTGFEELGLNLSDLDLSMGDTIYIELISTQDSPTKGPLDAMDNDDDQLSTSSGTIWDVETPIELDSMVMYVIQPFSGVIEGTVDYEDPLDNQTVATIKLFSENLEFAIEEIQTPPGGGFYRFDGLPYGSYRLEASATGYARLTRSNLVISEQDTLYEINFLMQEAAKLKGEVAFRDGPGNMATVTAYDSITGEIAGEGPIEIPATGGPYEFLVPDGTYSITAEAEGYIPDTVIAIVQNTDSVAADTLNLFAVRATKLVLIEEWGEEISSINTTVSIPDSAVYFYASAKIEARDDLDRRDYFNLDGYLDQVNLEAYKLNNSTPPRGNVVFYTPNIIPTSSIALNEGRGDFLVSDDEIEVLRIFTETEEGGITGRFKVGIRSPEPEFIELRALEDSIITDGVDEVVIEARLLDISRNPVRISGVPVSFSLSPTTTGKGTFKIPSTETSADGNASTSLLATGSGKLHVTASATYNKDLEVIGDDEKEYIEIKAVPGPPTAIQLTSESDFIGLEQSMALYAQLVDINGNPVPEEGRTITFSFTPVSAGNISPTSINLDASGWGSTIFEAGTKRTVVELSAISTPSLPVEGINFEIDRILFFSDPMAPEPDPGPNSFPAMDLTAVTIGNDPEGIEIRVKFASNWEGVHLGMVLETKNDPEGASEDPFGFPISYEHAHKPEYALTYKYALNLEDYADFRKWDGSKWLWWDDENEVYVQDWAEGANIRSNWITKGTAYVEYKVPFRIFEGDVPDSVRIQVYLMQEVEGEKRSAFDSAPNDATLDLDFDPLDPGADWSVTLTPVELQNYSPGYPINMDFPDSPIISSPKATPASIKAGETVTFSVTVTDGGDGVGNVLINLFPVGGPRLQLMRDDGTNGDATAGDGIYSHRYLVNPDVSGGQYDLTITAKDVENISRSDTTLTLTVEGITTAIRSFSDQLNDDHGPNLFGQDGLYYLYPTNSVFVLRAFDLEEVTIFETSKIVAGEIIPSLAFQVRMGNFPNPSDEGTADWNPLYADINIQKIDIYIDAFKGGATEGLPRRQNDFAKWDAWDYAIVMDGWYKGIIASNNQNTPQAWVATTKKSDKDIILLSDFEQNTITAVVSRETLGNPSKEEIQNWDLTVLMTSHDGHSDDNNFGDTRWVNASASEWQPGGGSDSDRDPNIIDLVFSPGLGKKPGRNQSALLNYKSDEAVARLENGETAVVLEATAFEDQGPPIINIGEIVEETVPITALINAPLYLTVTITDDDEVSGAIFKWRADSTRTVEWMGELPMGYAGADLWSVDLPVDEVTAKVPIAEYDSTRNIEFVIEARDPSGKTATTPLYTMEIPLPTKSFEVSQLDLSSGAEIRAPEGTHIWIPQSAIPQDLLDLPFNFKLTTHYLKEFSFPPHPVTSINVIRTIELEADTEPNPSPITEFEDLVEISFHYPQYSVESIDENYLAVYEYSTTTNTWIYLGGNVNPFGNLVTVNIRKPGTYGIFHDPSVGFDPNEVFSGVVFSPNPFSPNGDGLYEETNISFYLSQEATVTIEIFNIDGDRVRILKRLFPFTAEDVPDKTPRRITGMLWDGRDNTGKIVPYGIYIARFTVTFTQAAGERTIRKNEALAVIK